MKQLQTAICFALILLAHSPCWASEKSDKADTNATAAKSTKALKYMLSVSGALYRDHYLVMSFADNVEDGHPLEAQAQVTSSYVSKVTPDGEQLRLTPATYVHGYDLNITPVVMSEDRVQLSYRLHGVEVLGFVNPAAGVTATGAPQTSLLDVESTQPKQALLGNEQSIDFGCDLRWAREDKQDIQAVNCRYHLVVTVNKVSSQ